MNQSAVKSLFMNRPPRNHVGIRCPMGIPERKSPAQNTAQVKTALANGAPNRAPKGARNLRPPAAARILFGVYLLGKNKTL